MRRCRKHRNVRSMKQWQQQSIVHAQSGAMATSAPPDAAFSCTDVAASSTPSDAAAVSAIQIHWWRRINCRPKHWRQCQLLRCSSGVSKFGSQLAHYRASAVAEAAKPARKRQQRWCNMCIQMEGGGGTCAIRIGGAFRYGGATCTV